MVGGRWSSVLLTLALAGFLVATNAKLYRHVEYGGAIEQLGAVAQRFDRDDVLLFRGGAPTVGQFRDMPDNIVTPLAFAFGLDALTVKSAEPGHYAEQLARYVRRWQEQGREVFLVLGASGALGLPGQALEPAGRIELTLEEFEQLTDQKPSNVQTLTLDYAVYRLRPERAPATATSIAPGDFAHQARGFYRPEQIDGTTAAWTDGDALLRLPWPKDGRPGALTLRLGPGERPASLGPAEVCVSFRLEQDHWVENPAAGPFSAPECFALGEEMASYTLQIDPPELPASGTGTLLLRISSEAWVPAKADERSNDERSVGVLFGGLTVEQGD